MAIHGGPPWWWWAGCHGGTRWPSHAHEYGGASMDIHGRWFRVPWAWLGASMTEKDPRHLLSNGEEPVLLKVRTLWSFCIDI